MYVLYGVNACVGACVGCSFVGASVANCSFSQQAVAASDWLSLAQTFHIITLRMFDTLLLFASHDCGMLGCGAVLDFSNLS